MIKSLVQETSRVIAHKSICRYWPKYKNIIRVFANTKDIKTIRVFAEAIELHSKYIKFVKQIRRSTQIHNLRQYAEYSNRKCYEIGQYKINSIQAVLITLLWIANATDKLRGTFFENTIVAIGYWIELGKRHFIRRP